MTPEEPKCDFCDKPMTYYSRQSGYRACDAHMKEVELIEEATPPMNEEILPYITGYFDGGLE